VDYLIPYRLLLYMTEVWRDFLKNKSKKERAEKFLFTGYSAYIINKETIKKLDPEEFDHLFTSWTENILTRNIQPEEKNEVVTILQETRPEEVEQMISNVERVLKKTYKDAEIKGIEQGVTKVAQQMLLEDVDIEIIKRCTGLSDEEIEKL
jgi:predicted transposase/invertase (TIGR01784 family)